ncbi:shikimate dehydrogenase [Massilia niastensis]|uniref:shikimate dehydrogenase n=1 Tax=Massilia niastensis TaxID=544911 RepID=UPI0003689826|nr:shikimate dehydrogenase [Massilia niastensis]
MTTTTNPAAEAPVATARKLLVGLIGRGIGHSLSPAMHEQEARAHGIRLHYQLIDLAEPGAGPEDLPQLLKAMRAIGFAGFNVTFPYKQAILPLLDGLSVEAQAMGAVNTVVNVGGKLVGHNTDGSGWAWGFRRALPDADLERVVLLGAGGAGSAVADAALRLGVGQLVVVDIDPVRIAALADKLNAQHGAGRVSATTDLAAALDGASGLIHATPVGMYSQPGLPLAKELLRPSLWVSEVVYFPLDTMLLQEARARGCPTADGGGMAVGQAVGAFRLFTGLEPDPARIDAHFRALVAAKRPQE